MVTRLFHIQDKTMIKQLHKLMLLAVAALFAMDGYGYNVAYDVKINGICYNLDNVNLTAEVTFEGWNDDESIHNSYSGSVIIPTTINHNSNTYTVKVSALWLSTTVSD